MKRTSIRTESKKTTIWFRNIWTWRAIESFFPSRTLSSCSATCLRPFSSITVQIIIKSVSNPKCATSWSSSSRKAIWSGFLSSEWTRPPCKRCSKFACTALWTSRTTWIERAMCRPSRFSRCSRKACTTSADIGFNSEHCGLDGTQLFRSIGPRGTVHGAMRDRELVLFVL